MRDFVSSASQPRRNQNLPVPKSKSLVWPLVIILAVVSLDQITKAWALVALSDGHSHRVLGNFLMFTLVYNQGGAMGTQLGSSSYYMIMSILVIPVLAFFVYRYRTQLSLSLPLAFIVGGAAGNLVDRIRLGQVVDFIDVDFFDFIVSRFWTFNVADSAISCAIVFLLFHSLVWRAKETDEPNQATAL